jgi:hypothetical protein
MSNRFHNKWHRRNHHTYGNPDNPDAGHDPIASQQQPFLGEFVLYGSLSAIAPLSAYAGHFYSNNYGLCAYGGQKGMFLIGERQIGLEVKGTAARAISAYGPIAGLEVCSIQNAISAYATYVGARIYSSVRAISAFGEYIGGEFYSPQTALSAHGVVVGLDASSPNIAISATGGINGLNVVSPIVAISAFGFIKGLDVVSPNVAISAYAGDTGINVVSRKTALSAYADVLGAGIISPNVAISAFAGDVGINVTSLNTGISAFGINVGAKLASPVIALSAYSHQLAINAYSPLSGAKINGGIIGAQISSPMISLSTGGGGINIFRSRTGIYKEPRDRYAEGTQTSDIVLDVGGDIWCDGNVTIVGNLSTFGAMSYLDTVVTVTSAFTVDNKGTTPAATIIQTGNQPILQCFDQDIDSIHTVPSFIVDGAKNGWVAMGAATPTAPLYIKKSNVSTEANQEPQVRITEDGTTTKVAIGTPRNSVVSGHASIGTETSNYFDIITNNISRISVSQVGNVGVNEFSPTAKLQVFADNNSSYTALSAYGSTYGAIIAGHTRINYDGGASTHINSANTTTATVNIGTTGAASSNINVKGNTKVNEDVTSNTTSIGTGNTTGAITIGNTGLTGGIAAYGSPINLNNSAATYQTNIGTGSTTGAITIGNTGLTGGIAAYGSPINLNNNAGGYLTNIGTGSTTGNIQIGNVTNTTTALLGVGVSPTVRLDVSNNATVKTASSGTTIHSTQADSTNNRILVDSFGLPATARPSFTGRHARGTAVSPSAVQTDDVLAEFTAQGFGATVYSTTSRARMTVNAAENWTDTAQGSYIAFQTTATGGTTTSEAARIDAGGQFGIGGSPNAKFTVVGGTVNINASSNNTVNVNTGSGNAATSIHTSANASALGLGNTSGATNIYGSTIGLNGPMTLAGSIDINASSNNTVNVNTGSGNAATSIHTSANTSALGLGNTSGVTNINGSTITLNSGGNNNVSIGTSTAGTVLTVNGPISTKANSIVALTSNAYTVGVTDSAIIINNGVTTVTVTLPAASSYPGRWLHIKNISNCSVNSASSNVVPLATNSAGSAILTNTAGKFAQLQSNGTNWVVMAAN